MEASYLSLLTGRSSPVANEASYTVSAQEDADAKANSDLFRLVVASTASSQTEANNTQTAMVSSPSASPAEVVLVAANASDGQGLLALDIPAEQWLAFMQDHATLVMDAQSGDLAAIEALHEAGRWLSDALQAVQIHAQENATEQLATVDIQQAILVDASQGDLSISLTQPLSAEQLALHEAIAASVQQQEALLEEDEGVEALVGVALMLPLQQATWHTDLRDMAKSVSQLQAVDPMPAINNAPLSSLADAIAADDLSLLTDAEIAKLDALVDKIAQQSANGSSALKQFGAMLDAQLNELRGQGASTHESVSPSTLSASHASQQTRALDESLQLRSSAPAHFQGSAQQGSATEQVRVGISQALNAGMDRLTIQLDPADLGRVEVRIDVGADGRAQLLVQADNRDTLDLLQRDARALERALQEAGIQADLRDMAFDLRQGKDQSGSDESGTKPAQGNLLMNALATEESASPQETHDALMGNYTLSIAQGLNIQV